MSSNEKFCEYSSELIRIEVKENTMKFFSQVIYEQTCLWVVWHIAKSFRLTGFRTVRRNKLFIGIKCS